MNYSRCGRYAQNFSCVGNDSNDRACPAPGDYAGGIRGQCCRRDAFCCTEDAHHMVDHCYDTTAFPCNAIGYLPSYSLHCEISLHRLSCYCSNDLRVNFGRCLGHLYLHLGCTKAGVHQMPYLSSTSRSRLAHSYSHYHSSTYSVIDSGCLASRISHLWLTAFR